jgi:hypothetical protein
MSDPLPLFNYEEQSGGGVRGWIAAASSLFRGEYIMNVKTPEVQHIERGKIPVEWSFSIERDKPSVVAAEETSRLSHSVRTGVDLVLFWNWEAINVC